ncbi:GntR family transcriptional regulator [Hydrogenophaga sp. BPS33]|uniref:GntR family transcriptional regulator n=1 Tax=Hydrogenophaga sp. BPS33 TaxID=2651974 RepID=UPI0013200B4E|nr:GntR family transcriptional regulator [Hydrogenophaga sp. BPS33]QHE83859.1 GntR family transcriptional regulator [Hydrogenophaga sp. BPS33]
MPTRKDATPTPSDASSDPSTAETVFHGIVNGLETGQFVPGQRLVETDLAAQFGVGRNSVREALQHLAADGVIDTVRHKGAVVRSLSLQETLDVLDVAERMTGLLARNAARAVKNGNPAKALSQALERLAAAASSSSEGFAQARRHFYRVLLDLGGSKELRRLLRVIHMPIVHAQYRLGSLREMRLRDYDTIGRAVLRGNEAKADEAGAAHVRHVRTEILKKVGEEG